MYHVLKVTDLLQMIMHKIQCNNKTILQCIWFISVPVLYVTYFLSLFLSCFAPQRNRLHSLWLPAHLDSMFCVSYLYIILCVCVCMYMYLSSTSWQGFIYECVFGLFAIANSILNSKIFRLLIFRASSAISYDCHVISAA